MKQVLVVERDEEIAQRELERESVSVVSQHQHQHQLLERLIVEGSDALAFHICRRLQADRARLRGPMWADVLTWVEIAEWAKRERLLTAEEALLLQRLAEFIPRRPRAGGLRGRKGRRT